MSKPDWDILICADAADEDLHLFFPADKVYSDVTHLLYLEGIRFRNCYITSRVIEEGSANLFHHLYFNARVSGGKVLHVTALRDPLREMDKVHALYDSLMQARRGLGEDVVPFHRFAALVKDQVSKLRDSGTGEVAFRVAVKDGKVNFTVRGLKGEGK